MVCSVVSREMDQLAKMEGGPKSIKELMPDFLWNWSLAKAIAIPANAKTPSLLCVLQAAVSTSFACTKNKKKDSDTVCDYWLAGSRPFDMAL